ncbi:hypothetical protein GGI23_000155 [Coemansia sp. RSA 2559]|nr:hypothetical protein GGI23_000155 [Coemansia sp. RSA 2559]KAJ2869622.1 hypothetical protein GGI22_000140 [Coemansia erecta]
MVHNKEKGAARWTFDFFKEVAAIVEGDAHFMDLAKTSSPPSAGDDLNAYSFGSPGSVALSSGPPLMQHRMSEPNLNFNGPASSAKRPPPPPPQQQQQQALMSSHFHVNSPSRRTSYPQMQGSSSGPLMAVRQYPPPPPPPIVTGYPPPATAAAESRNDPERTCRYVLEMLEQQARRIDAQQESLSQLRESTKDAIRKVELVLRQYSRPQ